MRKLWPLLILTLLLSGCLRQKLDEDVLRQNIGGLLKRYQQGVNELDRGLLETVISDKFAFYDLNRTEYIDSLLTMTMLIDRMAYSNIRVENYKIFTDIQTEGSVVFHPKIPLPLFRAVPFMNGKLRQKSVFVFLYEEAAGLKILAEDQVLGEKDIIWGAQPPRILRPALSRYRVAPGDQVEVTFQVSKADNDVAFVFVNEQLLGGYTLDENAAEIINYSLKVPAEAQRGDNFEIKLMVFGGKVDLNNPQQAQMQGAAIKTFILPVR